MFWCKDTARSETLVITEVFWRDSQFNWIQISVLDFVFMLNDIHRYRFTLKLWNLWSALSLVLGTYPVWRGRPRRGCVNSADNLEPRSVAAFAKHFFGSHSKTVLDEYSEQRLPSAAQWLTTPLDASLWKKQVAFHPPSLPLPHLFTKIAQKIQICWWSRCRSTLSLCYVSGKWTHLIVRRQTVWDSGVVWRSSSQLCLLSTQLATSC